MQRAPQLRWTTAATHLEVWPVSEVALGPHQEGLRRRSLSTRRFSAPWPYPAHQSTHAFVSDRHAEPALDSAAHRALEASNC